MEDVNEYSDMEEFAEGSKIKASKNQQDILRISNFLWTQKQTKEEDFVLSHIQIKNQ
uniref:Uncharacterized protein n=1 Tax=Vombatus ursinus TaxID=29139 RepID=A0A4X2LR09_VOMUR